MNPMITQVSSMLLTITIASTVDERTTKLTNAVLNWPSANGGKQGHMATVCRALKKINASNRGYQKQGGNSGRRGYQGQGKS